MKLFIWQETKFCNMIHCISYLAGRNRIEDYLYSVAIVPTPNRWGHCWQCKQVINCLKSGHYVCWYFQCLFSRKNVCDCFLTSTFIYHFIRLVLTFVVTRYCNCVKTNSWNLFSFFINSSSVNIWFNKY